MLKWFKIDKFTTNTGKHECLSKTMSNVFLGTIRTLRYEDGELGRRRGWMSKTRWGPVVPAKNNILKSKQFSNGKAAAIFLSRTNMSTIKDARTILLESYLDDVIDDDEFILLLSMR